GQFQDEVGSMTCKSCAVGTASSAIAATSCPSCTAGSTFQDQLGQQTCDTCSTCSSSMFESAGCTTSSHAVCTSCHPSCLTCTGAAANQCASCTAPATLTGGSCVALCESTPRSTCLVAAQAQLQSNEKKPGKEKLQLQWKKIQPVTTRA